jgi:hypothetical protein
MSGFLKLSFVYDSRGNSFKVTELLDTSVSLLLLDSAPLLKASPLEELLDCSDEDDLAELLDASLSELEELRATSSEELLGSSDEDEISEPGSSSTGFTEEVSSPQAAKSATVPIRAKRFKTGKKSLSAKIFILPPFKISTAVKPLFYIN